jgi:hypothetical protein
LAINFLGHRSAAGVTPLNSSLQVMYNFPRPHTIKDLQRFLGMVNFYRRFLPKIAQILSPLTDLLKGKDLPKVLPWEEQHNDAKVALAGAMLLAHPWSDVPLALATDTSDPTRTSAMFCSSRYVKIGIHLVGDRGELLHL